METRVFVHNVKNLYYLLKCAIIISFWVESEIYRACRFYDEISLSPIGEPT